IEELFVVNGVAIDGLRQQTQFLALFAGHATTKPPGEVAHLGQPPRSRLGRARGILQALKVDSRAPRLPNGVPIELGTDGAFRKRMEGPREDTVAPDAAHDLGAPLVRPDEGGAIRGCPCRVGPAEDRSLFQVKLTLVRAAENLEPLRRPCDAVAR